MFVLKPSVSVGCIKALGFQNGSYRYAIDPNFPRSLQEIKETGIEQVELDVFGMYYPETFEAWVEKAADMTANVGLRVNSVHFPFGQPWTDLASPWESDRTEIVKWLAKIFQKLERFAPTAYVFHPGGAYATEENRGEAMVRLCKSADELSEATNARVCVENMVGGTLLNTVDKVLEFTEKALKASVVLDVNHLLHDKPEDAILRIGNRIQALHVSDYDFVYERHVMPGDGKIEWMKVLGALETIGYKNAFNYEIRMNGYTYKDIKNNYDEMFARYNATRRG